MLQFLASAVLLLGMSAANSDEAANIAGLEAVEISAHHFYVSNPHAENTGRLMRRDSAQTVDRKALDAGVAVELDAVAEIQPVASISAGSQAGIIVSPASSSSSNLSTGPAYVDLIWGSLGFNYVSGTQECKETGNSTWWGQSTFEMWNGTDSGLTMTAGTTVDHTGTLVQATKGLLIYKAACPNSTAVKVGGTTEIPARTTSIDIVFGIARRCTGDCAPFMVTLLNNEMTHVKYTWCWNREGDAPDIICDKVLTVPHETWNKVQLDITNFTDFTSGNELKLALEVYTSGDYRLLPTMSDQVGLGGTAMVLIDSLVFNPGARPSPNSNFTASAVFCRQSMREVCTADSWCFDKYRCKIGWCAEGKARCNGKRNCVDDSDEVGCDVEGGFRGEFYFSHARQLNTQGFQVSSLTKPDLRLLKETINYDADDFWQTFHASSNLYAKWTGNLTINNGGPYRFSFNANPGHTQMSLVGTGSVSDKIFSDVRSMSWMTLPSGNYEIKIGYLYTAGSTPAVALKYYGQDTSGQARVVGSDVVSATMTGSRCDTMTCSLGDSLKAKPSNAKILCESVPCTRAADTATCCSREYKFVAAGDYRTCALDMMGRPVCWGSWSGFNEEWQNHQGPYKDISTRGNYICAVLQSNGTADCWQPDSADASAVLYSSGGLFLNISVGGAHTCALRDSGYPACAGDETYSQIDPPANTEFSQISAGEDFTCGITTSTKTVRCWGANARGQANPPTGSGYDAFTDLDAGYQHACGISNGSAHCWGWNNDAQATAPAGGDFWQIAPGAKHTCALKNTGRAVCWGANSDGQATVNPLTKFSMITAGHAHTCAIRASDSEVVCWGSNYQEDASGVNQWSGQAEPPPAGIWP